MCLYMVVEKFHPGGKKAIYDRLAQKGRMLPKGLKYVDSWLARKGDCCFQLMETEDIGLFAIWIKQWKDLVDFEIVTLGKKPA